MANKINMPKNRDEFEWCMLHAFYMGMQYGYGIDHENKDIEEKKELEEYAKRNGFKRTSLK